MNTGSMERALITKAMSLREFSQWTAATTLVAAGTLALFSASTLEKISGNGEVSIDVGAFKKLGSTSLALDRFDEKLLILEDKKLSERAQFAAAEALPSPRTAFAKIQIKHSKAATRQVLAKARAQRPAIETVPGAIPITLTSSEVTEIAQLEKARDPTRENHAIADMYTKLRFRFFAAAETPNTDSSFPEESLAIARASKRVEYDEVPDFNEADFGSPPPAPQIADSSEIETAPSKAEVVLVEKDQIQVSASSTQKSKAINPPNELTANATIINGHQTLKSKIPLPAVITTSGLDLVPETPLSLPQPARVVVSSHENLLKEATGPPDEPKIPENNPSSSLHTKSLASITPPSDEAVTIATADDPSDLREYSKDMSAVYEGYNLSDPMNEEATGEYSVSGSTAKLPVTIQVAKALPPKKVAMEVPTLGGNRNYGNGIRSDVKGITINWNEGMESGGKNSPTALGGKIFVGKPGQQVAESSVSADVQDSLKKFSFTKPITVSQSVEAPAPAVEEAVPTVEMKKCETARIGVEAFNPSAEKESLSVCRRQLSLEGASDGKQARWWESYENEAEHWPTLSFQAEGEANAANRIPLLSTASIRILSALTKTNTHTGTGILFGEVTKGLEIQLLGRSDAPLYLDGGMKIHDSSAEQVEKRQFVFLNVEPGQPLLVVKNREKNISGAIPLVVKSGMATHLKVTEPKEQDLDLTVLDASTAKESRLANLTAEVVGQPGKLGITDRTGNLKIPKVVVFNEFPIFVDILKNEKTYKNRFRLRPTSFGKATVPLFFFDEKRVSSWLAQLSGGISPFSGLIAGVAPSSILSKSKDDIRQLKIGILEKKNTLVPERYLLDEKDHLVSDASLHAGLTRYIGVQIPEGAAIPTIVDGKGRPLWSELVYSQPGVINVITPEL